MAPGDTLEELAQLHTIETHFALFRYGPVQRSQIYRAAYLREVNQIILLENEMVRNGKFTSFLPAPPIIGAVE